MPRSLGNGVENFGDQGVEVSQGAGLRDACSPAPLALLNSVAMPRRPTSTATAAVDGAPAGAPL